MSEIKITFARCGNGFGISKTDLREAEKLFGRTRSLASRSLTVIEPVATLA